MDTSSTPRSAVVLGAGIAGLAMARVLHDFFDAVVLVEPHPLPADDRPRGGVPQAHHIHGLTARGLDLMEELFPGLDRELEDAGTPRLDHGRDVLTCFPTGNAPRVDTDLGSRLSSRALMEARIRGRVLALPNVEPRTGLRVTGLVTDAARSAVRAVATDDGGTVPGDLVVDTTGRFSRLPRRLADAGFPTPPTRTIDAGVGYASGLFEAPDQSWLALIQPTVCPDRTRGAYIGKLEGSRWMVTLVGACGDHPPADQEGFRAFADRLDNPVVAAFLAEARPVSPLHRYVRTENHRTDYHRMPAWPDRFLVAGDAVCAFNPLYGQGIGVALEQALLLRSLLAARTGRSTPSGPVGVAGVAELTGLAREFQRRLPRTTGYAWRMSTFQDAIWARHRAGRTTRRDRAVTWYLDRLYRAAAADPATAATFARVFQRAAPPTALLGPRVLLRILRGG
ncbi:MULTISPECIES: putative oxidoreductase [Kitasatospora]|uniref:Putative oxidoreductase n=1 Tax=Kitasatospora setae (strain ATCC 33774 / DSM 43861 / JCM 3304 / KCC A-0304 / NBRC 14216 / KM-6054) TaxID=452652 RepID=E4NJC0_KITSK|nr:MULTISPECIES: putative oxidoreductase [Kitasatospora]BAJ33068.1 putative oxidoreductase [Kitasatospora setae KM-6054]